MDNAAIELSGSHTANPPRPRLPRACNRCARRKLRCDKARPRCARCSRDNAPCEYAISRRSSDALTFIDETPQIASSRSFLSSRLERLGRFLAPHEGADTAADDETTRENNTNPSLSFDTRPSTSGSDEQQHDAGHLLKGAQTKYRYLSPTFFAMIRQELSEIETLVRNQRRASVYHPSSKSPHYPSSGNSRTSTDARQLGLNRFYGDLFPPALTDRTAGSDHVHGEAGYILDQIVVEMPAQEQQNVLISAYMSGYHTVTPLFHGVSFLQQIWEFQNTVDKSAWNANAHFLALLNAVLFAGTVVCPRTRLSQAFPDISRDALTLQLYHLSIKAIRVSGFPRSPSLYSLAAYIIIDTTWLRDEDPLVCFAFIGTAFRAAQMLGMHRDPSNFPNISATEQQVRRHIWFTLISIDAQVAFASGLPPLIEATAYNVLPVSEESEVLSDGAGTPSSHDDSILGIFVAGKYNFYSRTGEFLRVLHSNIITADGLQRVLDIADEVRQEMSTRIDRIGTLRKVLQSHMAQIPEHDSLRHAELNSNLARFATIVLAMLAAKPWAIMYGPLRQHGFFDLRPGLRPNAVMQCRTYLLLFLMLTQQQDFQPWHWCWPGQHQPLHSITALIAHVDEFPDDPLASETRKLIDMALHMCRGNSYGGIVANDSGELDDRALPQDSHEAWRFIHSARDRAWERAGLDADLLLCPPSVSHIRFDGMSLPELIDPGIDVEAMNTAWLDGLPPVSTEDWALLGQMSGQLGDLGAANGNFINGQMGRMSNPLPGAWIHPDTR